MNLLVTGGAGFIGSNFIRHVIDRPEIQRLINLDGLTYAGHLANLTGLEAHPKYEFIRLDLAQKQALFNLVRKEKITHVIHLAAESHVDRSISGPDAFIHTNIVGTFHLLEACRSHWLGAMGFPRKQRCFLHVSTDEVYGSLGAEGSFTEQSCYAPNSPYSASKAASDLLVRSYGHTYHLPVVITHCSNNYGPYQFPEKLIPVAILNAFERKPIPVYGDGLNVRDWLYVVDHAQALWTVLCHGRHGESYNIGAENEWPNLRIVQLIGDLVDELKPDLPGRARDLIRFVADRPGHDRRYAIDAGKIRRELGWRPAHDFHHGLRKTVQWYFDHMNWVNQVLHDAQMRSPSFFERNETRTRLVA
ncbi:MAG: dTDP-glucose 4,6-dehydratase [Verrucomicrobiota bacterium]